MGWRRRLVVSTVVATLSSLGSGLSSNPQDPTYRRAWKAVTSGGGPTEKPSVPTTPEERERQWAAKIIEQHERRKKVAEIQTMVNKVSEAVDETAQVAKPPPTPPPPQKDEDRRQRMVLDVFDGRLGRVRLSLRSSAEAMLTIVGEFDAVATNEPGVVVVKGRHEDDDGGGEDVECLVDAKRCSAIEFTQRSDQQGQDQYAITMKRLDETSFLSVLLGGGDYPSPDAVKRWADLKAAYEGNLGKIQLVPEGGIDRRPSVDAGPLRPQGGPPAANGKLPLRPAANAAAPDQPRQKREIKPVKPEILIPRTD